MDIIVMMTKMMIIVLIIMMTMIMMMTFIRIMIFITIMMVMMITLMVTPMMIIMITIPILMITDLWHITKKTTSTCIFSGYDGGSSDSECESPTVDEQESQAPLMPDFWLIVKIHQDRVEVYSQSR